MEEIIKSLYESYSQLIEIIAFSIAFFFIERINPAEKNTRFFKDDMKNEVLIASLNLFIFIPIMALIITLLVQNTIGSLIKEQLFAEQIHALPLIIQIAFGAILLDFSTYWRHRFTHFYMWSYHSVHHSAKQITWITGFRLHPIDLLVAILVDSIILYFLGFSGAGFFGAIVIVKLMNYMTHMNFNLKYGKPLRYIIASPHYHRWHHATIQSAYNKNFCGSFPFLDILFGTYYHPEELPTGYGLSPNEQKDFPEKSYIGWLAYPFKREFRLWKKKFNKKKDL